MPITKISLYKDIFVVCVCHKSIKLSFKTWTVCVCQRSTQLCFTTWTVCRSPPGLAITFCGHAMHKGCLDRYRTVLRRQHKHTGYGAQSPLYD